MGAVPGRSTRSLGVMKVTVAVVVVAVTLGASVFALAAKDKPQPVPREQAEAAAVGILTSVDALTRLRGGDTAGAIAVLEASLHSNITIVGGSDAAASDPNIRKIVARAADYRGKHPYKSSYPELDAQVSDILKRYRKDGQ
jgi:hypothetical protein